MKLIKPSYEILTPVNKEQVYKDIERAARTCYKSEDKITDDSAAKMVSRLIASGHEAMIEHSVMSVKFICDRGVSHELVRHRIASFAQESSRYCNYSNDKFNNNITYIVPSWIDYNKVLGVINLVNQDNKEAYRRGHDESYSSEDRSMYSYLYDMSNAEHGYLFQISSGWTPQQARSILPHSVKTEIIVTANFREWRQIFKLRAAKAAHPQMRELMIPLLAEMKEKMPEMFNDINVE